MFKVIMKTVVREDHWDFLSWYRKHFGVVPTLLSYIDLLRNKELARAPNALTGSCVFLRPGTTDQAVYDEIFVDRKYDIDLGNPLFIVDAGAHIGLSSVFFASKYPKATVVAIEPEQSNFNILLRNVKKYTNIKPMRAGLWSKRTYLRIQDSNATTWGFRVSEDSSEEGIPAVGILEVMTNFNAKHIDVLKIDIEGSELEVFKHYQPWINVVRTLIIELHDRFQPGCTEALAKAISGHDYNRSRSGESIVITNLRRTAT